MINPTGYLIKNVTLGVVRDIIRESNAKSCINITKGDIDMLRVDLVDVDYMVIVDGDVLALMVEVKASTAGNFYLASEWNMLETIGTAVCLDTGYVMKFGVFISGGIVRETLRDAIFEFNKQVLKFVNKVQCFHQ